MGFITIFLAIIIIILIGFGVMIGVAYVVMQVLKHLGPTVLTALYVIFIALILTAFIYTAQ